jgi:glycolate oxidase iron-sulfur subunit
MTRLNLDEELLAACVSCGLCLPHCPTYRVTGEELLSPRGRIAVMRAVEDESVAFDSTVVSALDTCVMCRNCETACPSGVQFGQLMESTRTVMSSSSARPPVWLRYALLSLGRDRLILAASSLLGIAQRLRLVPRSLVRLTGAPPRVPIRRTKLTGLVDPSQADVFLYTGCVMDAWQRDVHADALALMRATGAKVAVPKGGSCCGALLVHSGLTAHAKQFARDVIAACPGSAPIVVDSAGCGAALQDYGHLLHTDEARAFSARVVDISSWLGNRVGQLGDNSRGKPAEHRETVIVQDPCHLRHVQRAHLSVRTLLQPFVDIVELSDDGRCCGAGGAYSVLQPTLATAIREAKVKVIREADPTGTVVVASGNPGCSMWLSQGGVRTEHPVTIVARHGRKAGWLNERT